MSFPAAKETSVHREADTVILHREWIVLTLVLGEVLILHFLRNSRHLEIISLAVEYVLLLPAILWWLARLRGTGNRDLSPRRTTVVATIVFSAMSVPLARYQSQNADYVDEGCYQFQARIFQTGHAMAEPLPGASENVKKTPPELDYQNHVLTTRGWFTHFPPGWPLLLAVGQWLRVPWLLNPLMALGLLTITFVIGREVFSTIVGQIAVIMMAFSPFLLVNTARVLSHIACSVLVAGACLLIFRGLEQSRLGPFVGAFALLVLAIQVRTYTGFAEALVLGVATLWYTRCQPRLFRHVMFTGIGFGVLAAAVTMFYYDLYTGSPLVSPYAARVGAVAPSELTLNPRLLIYSLHHLGPTTFRDTLFGTFPFLFLLAGYGLWREEKKIREVRILAAVFAVVVVAYMFHTESSYSFYGSRFHFEGFFAAAILAARGTELLAHRWALPHRAVAMLLFVFSAMQLMILKGAAVTTLEVRKPYREMRLAVAKVGATVPLVFLHEGGDYNPRFINFNDADWRHARVVYLIDADPAQRNQWACSFGRHDWIVLTLDALTGSVQQQRGHSNCAAATVQARSQRAIESAEGDPKFSIATRR